MLRFVVWMAALAGAASAAETWNRPPVSAQELAAGYRNDVVLARPAASHADAIASEEAAEGTVVRRVFPLLGGIRVLAVRPGETPDQAIARLKATGRYAYVARDRLLHALDTTPDDTDFVQQWALNNTGNNLPIAGVGIAGADIHAPAAWDTRHDATQVIVATVDTGLLLTHQDIIQNLWTNPQAGNDGYGEDLHGINAISGAANVGDPTDDVGHGTHVAGIIGAVGNNSFDTSGVAWSAQIMALKFLGPNGTGGSTTEELTCLSYAVAHGAKIINASYGALGPNPAEFDAILQLQENGVILVCAAGNSSENNDLSNFYPASYPLDNIIAVAATDNRDDLASFSNFGSGCVDVGAPGDTILSLYNTSDSATILFSGTSMAAPMVTGSLALIEAQFPSISYRQALNRLRSTVDADPNLAGRVQTGGRIDLAGALTAPASANAPFNDNFEQRAHLVGSALTVRGNNELATREATEPANGANASLWWDWTAPFSGTVILSASVQLAQIGRVEPSYPAVLGVYTGSSLSSLSAVQVSTSGSLNFAAQAGVTYDFTMGSQTSATGGTYFSLAYANSSAGSAISLSGPSVIVTGTTNSGTSSNSATLYYTWTAPKTGPVRVVVSSGDMDPAVSVSGQGSASATQLSSEGTTINASDIAPVSVAALGFDALQGASYTIAVSGGSDPGNPDVSAGEFVLALNDARWSASAADAFRSSPAVSPGGTVYIGSDDSTLYAFNPDGTTQWIYTGGEGFDSSSPAVGPDGSVYAGDGDGFLYSLGSGGTLNWKYAVPNSVGSGGSNYISSSPAVGADGTVYFKDSTNSLYALNPDGTLKWTATVPGASYCAPAVGADGTVYIGSDDGNGGGMLYAFNPDGTSHWSFNANSPIYTAPAIDASGNLYFATLGGTLYAVDASGQELWSYAAANSISSAPAIGSDGTLYFGCYDHNLYAVSSAGALKWTCPLGGEVRASAPVIDGNGVVYLGCYDGFIYAVNPDGTLNRTFATAGQIRSAPLIFGTTLYCGSNDHRLYAFDISAGASGSAWPMYMAEAQRNGRVLSPALAITAQPSPSVVLNPGTDLTLTVAAVGQGPLSFQWYLNGTAIAGATNSTYLAVDASASAAGSYTVTVSGPQGSLTSRPSEVGPAGGPVIVTQPQSQTVSTGGNATLAVAATGGNLAYQWAFAGSPIAGATGATLSLTNVGANQGAAYGSYTVAVSNTAGTVTSAPAALTVVTQARLLNLSARADVQSSQQYLIAGFALSNGSKQVLMRGIGPALAGYGISDPLANPALTLYNNQTGTQLDANSGWNSDLASVFSQVGAFALTPGSADAALLENLAPGQYSIHVEGADGETGVALAELYDADQGTVTSRLVNISASATVGTGADVLIAGFVISGTTSETVLLRGVGPTLASLGVSNVLQQPVLTLFDQNSNPLTSNTGWANSSAIAAVSSAVYAFALEPNSADSALLVTLAPGLYSIGVSGANSTTGEALVEVYEVR